MVWRFYSGVTELNDTEIAYYHIAKQVKSHLTNSRMLYLMLDYVHEAYNSKSCQVGVDGSIDAGYAVHAIGCFFTQHKGTMRYP